MKVTRENYQYLLYKDPFMFSQFCRWCQYGNSARKLKEFHKEWINMFEENDESLLLSFRGSMKSTIAVDYVLHRAIFHWPEQQLIVTENRRNVQAFFGQIMDVAGRKDFQGVFPQLGFDDKNMCIYINQKEVFPWQESIISNPNRKEPRIIITTLDTRSTGLHIDTGIMLLDDVYASAKIYGRVMWDSAVRVINTTWRALCKNPKILILGTRYSDQDPYEDLIRRGIKWNEGTQSVYVKKNGIYQPAWPEVWPEEEIERKRAELGEIDFALQYCNDTKLSKGKVFTSKLISSITDPTSKLEEVKQGKFYKYFGVDMAYGGKDNTSIVCAYFIKEGTGSKIYLYPESNINYKGSEVNIRYEDIIKITGGNPTYVEANGPQKQNISILKNMGHRYCNGYNPKISKVDRAKELVAAMERGEVRIIDNKSRDLSSQMLSFTGKEGGKDDLVDASYMAWKLANERVRNNYTPLNINIKRNEGDIMPDLRPGRRM